MKQITSADNAYFKQLQKLAHSSRERRLEGLSLLDGVHLLQAYLAHGGVPQRVLLSDTGARNAEILVTLKGFESLDVMQFTDALFNQLSSVSTPTGVITVIKTPRLETPPEVLETCVMLEDVQDPGNIGSILRSCAAAGVKQVFLSKASANAWSPRVLRAAMGAHFSTTVYERMDLQALAQRFTGQVLVTRQKVQRTIYAANLTGDIAFIFGNEGAGVSIALAHWAHGAVCIPMLGETESLNVAASAAICLFERVRQLRHAKK